MISALVGNQWVIAGGSSSTDMLLNDTNVYSITRNTWVPYGSVTMPRAKGNAPAAVMGGSVFVPGGIESTYMGWDWQSEAMLYFCGMRAQIRYYYFIGSGFVTTLLVLSSNKETIFTALGIWKHSERSKEERE